MAICDALIKEATVGIPNSNYEYDLKFLPYILNYGDCIDRLDTRFVVNLLPCSAVPFYILLPLLAATGFCSFSKLSLTNLTISVIID